MSDRNTRKALAQAYGTTGNRANIDQELIQNYIKNTMSRPKIPRVYRVHNRLECRTTTVVHSAKRDEGFELLAAKKTTAQSLVFSIISWLTRSPSIGTPFTLVW